MAKYTIILTPRRIAPTLSFTFDVTTGAIAGPDATFAGAIIADAERAQFVPIEPHPQGHRIGPAPHSLIDIAAIFAANNVFDLPDWLNALCPSGDSGGAVDESDAELIF